MAAKPRLSAAEPADRQRLDKWLWFARVVKTRRQAVDLIAGGHVRVDSRRIEAPAKLVGPGETLTIALERHVRVLRITGLAGRRGSAAEAQKLFVDLNANELAAAPVAV